MAIVQAASSIAGDEHFLIMPLGHVAVMYAQCLLESSRHSVFVQPELRC